MNDHDDEITQLKQEVAELREQLGSERARLLKKSMIASCQNRIMTLNRQNAELRRQLELTDSYRDALKRVAAMGGVAFEALRKIEEP